MDDTNAVSTTESARAAATTRARIKDHLVEVTEVTDITPWYRRIEVAANGLLDHLDVAPGIHVLLSVPTLDGSATVQRSYTIHRADPARDRFCFDFILHEPAGPGCHWAATATPGVSVPVSEAPYHLVIPEVSQALLVADTTALPAIDALLETLPDSVSTTVLIEDDHADHDLIPLPDRAASVTWHPALSEEVLAATTGALDPSDSFCWAGGERHLAKLVRDHVRSAWPVPRQQQHIQTYWIAGKG
ncbi:MAG: siderophore-interacting protein [Propionibacteriaceae bacterium]|jgi:ATP-binding cassette subfamily B protein IrtA|nr:siderophore-interacting protein [Propionibacteriaceae bacterium]